MPDIYFNCSRCKQSLVVDAAGIGLTVPCPNCGISVVIPPASAPPPAEKTPEVTAPKTTSSKTKVSEVVLPKAPAPVPQPAAPMIKSPETKPPEAPAPKPIVPEVPVPKAPAPAPALLKAAISKVPGPDLSRSMAATVSIQELINMLLLTAGDLECELDVDAAAFIARSSNGNVESARKCLRRVLQHGRSGTVAPVITLQVAVEGVKVFEEESQKPSLPARNF